MTDHDRSAIVRKAIATATFDSDNLVHVGMDVADGDMALVPRLKFEAETKGSFYVYVWFHKGIARYVGADQRGAVRGLSRSRHFIPCPSPPTPVRAERRKREICLSRGLKGRGSTEQRSRPQLRLQREQGNLALSDARQRRLEARKRERVRCSSLVDWPVYPRWTRTVRATQSGAWSGIQPSPIFVSLADRYRGNQPFRRLPWPPGARG
jgi:hypothetical protein